MAHPPEPRRKRRPNNPWEVLVVAALFFVPGFSLLFQRETIVAFQQTFHYLPSGATALSPHGAHLFGLLAMAVGLVFVWFYFRLRRAIEHDEEDGIRYE